MYAFLSRVQNYAPIKSLENKSPIEKIMSILSNNNIPISSILSSPFISQNLSGILSGLANGLFNNMGQKNNSFDLSSIISNLTSNSNNKDNSNIFTILQEILDINPNKN